VACQSKLRQWGVAFCAYTTDYDGKFFPWWPPYYASFMQDNRSCLHWPYKMRAYYRDCNDLRLCPATKPGKLDYEHILVADDKFSVWWYCAQGQSGFLVWYFGSYGLNAFIGKADHDYRSYRGMWNTSLVPDADCVPVLFDCMSPIAGYYLGDYEWIPPEYEGACGPEPGNRMNYACIERHVGGVNSLFMDWSVRKVGLKELWTLKWHREYNTRGPWTKAGGVRPENWPQWMRKFKDY
jgi:prepilin-type processing-associated H-X9-DG protein